MRKFIFILCGLVLTAHIAFADTVKPAVPIDRPVPDYPAGAGQIEGYVTLGFKIGADGHVKDAVVIEGNPKAIFDQAALDAVTRWTFQPRTINGQAVDQPDNQVRLRFKPDTSERAVLYAPQPSYPKEAFEAKVEGTVKVAFDVTPDGLTTNVHATETSLPGVFDKAAVENVEKWQFQALPAGSGSSTTTMSAIVAFKLSDARVTPKPVRRTPPHYPMVAEDGGIMGGCTVDFVIAPNGSVQDLKINQCFPKNVFEESTLDAVKTWLFEPGQGPSGPIPMPARITVNYRISGVRDQDIHYLKAGQWIKLKYTLTEKGRAADIEVTSKSDPDLSDSRAIDQIKNTQFAPIVENGKPVEKADQEIRIVGK